MRKGVCVEVHNTDIDLHNYTFDYLRYALAFWTVLIICGRKKQGIGRGQQEQE